MKRLHRLLFINIPLLIRAAIIKVCPPIYPVLRFKPYLATLNVTEKCCLRCIMCNLWRESHPDELKKDDWFRILDELKLAGVQEVNFTGGEALMRTDIFDLIHHANTSGMKCGLTTNGYLLTEKNINRLIQSGVRIFNISMDAVGSAYDDIRGVQGGYERLYSACQRLSRVKKEQGVDVYLCFLLMKKTLAHYKSVLAIGEESGLPVVINLFDVNPYFFQSAAKKDDFWIGREEQKEFKEFLKYMVNQKSQNKDFTYHSFIEIDYFSKYFKDPLQKTLPCVVSQSRLCVGPKGQVYGGCWAMGEYGQLRQQSLKDIMRSDKFKTAHKKMFFKDCPGCSCGYATNLRYSFRNVLTELGYRMFPKKREKIYIS
ncbi:MAG: radical SAM protein [Candidatus Omnitrophica bacterium]|nr:radical SAM protein [Candidatus Omnitrophota bacterium]